MESIKSAVFSSIEAPFRIKIRGRKANNLEAKGNKKFVADKVGEGQYASVFRATESVAETSDEAIVSPELEKTSPELKKPSGEPGVDAVGVDTTEEGRERPLSRLVVAKVFKDNAPLNYESVFDEEKRLLKTLGARENENIVGLRGVIDEFPPSFVCNECGLVYHRQKCPDCCIRGVDSQLVNDDARVGFLVCVGNEEHEFHSNNKQHVEKMAADRPCGHVNEPFETLNFLFRPCILLDELHVHLREFIDLLRGAYNDFRGHKIVTDAEFSSKPSDDWKRETFLMGLGVLVKTAEALAHIHALHQLHGDIAPENVMVKLSQPFAKGGPQSIGTRLIDFGRAKPVVNQTHTQHVRGRPNFMAPELSIVDAPISGTVCLLSGKQQMFPEASSCYMYVSAEVDLGVGDQLRDSLEGRYTVAEMLSRSRLEGDETNVSRDVGKDLQAEVDSSSVYPPAALPHFPHVKLLCRLEVVTPPEKISIQTREIADVKMWMTMAHHVPSDIYSLGCLILWIITQGGDGLIDEMVAHAKVARSQRLPVDKVFTEENLKKELFDKLKNAIWLPNEVQDNAVRKRLLTIVASCLVRGGEGAYCEGRSTGFDGAALKAVNDLKGAYDHLFFIHRTNSNLVEWEKERQLVIAQANAESKRLNQVYLRQQAEISEARSALAQAKAELEAWKNSLLEEFRSAGKDVLIGQIASLTRSIKNEQAVHDLQVKTLEAKHQNELNDLRRTHEEEKAGLNSRLDQAVSAAAERLKELTEAYESRLLEKDQEAKSQREKFEDAEKLEADRHREELRKQREKFEEAERAASDKHRDEIREQREKANVAEKLIADKHRQELVAQREDYDKQMAKTDSLARKWRLRFFVVTAAMIFGCAAGLGLYLSQSYATSTVERKVDTDPK